MLTYRRFGLTASKRCNRQNRTRVNFGRESCRKLWGGFGSATGVESPERGVKMDKEAELIGTNDNDGSPAESSPPVPYRILCNSEHFIVLNPVQRKRPKETVRVDDGHDETSGPSKRFQTIIKSAREKGRILRPDPSENSKGRQGRCQGQT